MKKLILLMAIVCSCNTPFKSQRYVCNCDQREKVAQFISKNIAGANNMSDEEMEDVIAELRKTGYQLYCDSRVVWVEHDTHVVIEDRLKLDSCETVMPAWGN